MTSMLKGFGFENDKCRSVDGVEVQNWTRCCGRRYDVMEEEGGGG